MSIKLTPISIYGCIQYVNKESNIVSCKIQDKWYFSLNDILFDASFCNIQCMQNFVNTLDEHIESLNMLGYYQVNNIFINDAINGFLSEISIKDDGKFEIRSCYREDTDNIHYYRYSSYDFKKIENYIIHILDTLHIDIFSSVIIESKNKIKHIIEAKMSSRNLSQNLVRVKSSNIWSYGIDIQNKKDKAGDVIVQFKDAHGGPGDLYQYFSIPISVWRKWLAAPSKGSFFWRYIRNEYKYRKLTGDKKGKLPNAIN